ncbi:MULTISPECIES: transcriptional regulator [Stenotrophomonas]|uniref:transcriptional regulator n=1 Tax=Stenotrophomonas TaxID=40323 RepID=UPI00114C9610|nr:MULTISPECIES: transcriptional regulator [Stenotrophomonas]
MNIRPLQTEHDYHQARQQLAAWFDDLPEPGSEEGDAFEVMLVLVANYENAHFSME